MASATKNDGEFVITGSSCGPFIQLSEKFMSPLIKHTAVRVRCTGETIKAAVNELHLLDFGTSGSGVASI